MILLVFVVTQFIICAWQLKNTSKDFALGKAHISSFESYIVSLLLISLSLSVGFDALQKELAQWHLFDTILFVLMGLVLLWAMSYFMWVKELRIFGVPTRTIMNEIEQWLAVQETHFVKTGYTFLLTQSGQKIRVEPTVFNGHIRLLSGFNYDKVLFANLSHHLKSKLIIQQELDRVCRASLLKRTKIFAALSLVLLALMLQRSVN